MNKLPATSTAIRLGKFNPVLVAWPPSGHTLQTPLPATVVIVPSRETFLIRQFPLSAMKRLPLASNTNPPGLDNCALTAGPPSPEKAYVPLPAKVVIMPFGET